MKVCVVVPTYNERENMVSLVRAVKAAEIPGLELICVDDSSPDGTADAIREISAQEQWVHLILRDAKKGIGSAYQEGFRQALDSFSPDVLVEMDADLQHPPSVLHDLIFTIEKGADVAVASRYVEGGGTVGWGLPRRAISRGANIVARLFLHLEVRDCTSGFRAYNRATAAKVVDADFPARGFEFQVAVLNSLRKQTKIVEVPFIFSARKAGKSKLSLTEVTRFLLSVVRMSLE